MSADSSAQWTQITQPLPVPPSPLPFHPRLHRPLFPSPGASPSPLSGAVSTNRCSFAPYPPPPSPFPLSLCSSVRAACAPQITAFTDANVTGKDLVGLQAIEKIGEGSQGEVSRFAILCRTLWRSVHIDERANSLRTGVTFSTFSFLHPLAGEVALAYGMTRTM